jgi:hypothetical protein
MAQTLHILGLPNAGFAFHEEFSHKELNPNGYWDLPIADTINGIHDSRYAGYIVKIFGYQLLRTNPEKIKRIVYCVRDKETATASTLRLLNAEPVLIARFGLEATLEMAEKIYDMNNYSIKKYLYCNSGIPNIIIRYEDMLNNKVKTVRKIADFICSNRDISNAVGNIRGQLCQ